MMTVIPILIGTLGAISEGLVKRLKGFEISREVGSSRLRSLNILRRVLET